MFHRVVLASLLCSSPLGLAKSNNWYAIPVIDPMGYIRTLMCQRHNLYAIVEDDIIVKKFQDPNEALIPNAAILHKFGGGRWPQGKIPYTFSPNLSDNIQKSILLAMQIWEMHTKVHFEKINPKTSNEHDYLLFIPDFNEQCSSFVGRQGGPQPLILANRCTTMNIVHELGHALGLWHEQSRLDRDNYVRILWENITEEHWYNFNQHITDGKDYEEYDYQSIMHYSAYAFSKNQQKTILPLQRDVEIGQRRFLSSKDIAAVNAMCTD
jgi:hypothetical protein